MTDVVNSYTREQWERRFQTPENAPPGPVEPRCVICDKKPGHATHRGDPRNFCRCPAPAAATAAVKLLTATELDVLQAKRAATDLIIHGGERRKARRDIADDAFDSLLATARSGLEAEELLAEEVAHCRGGTFPSDTDPAKQAAYEDQMERFRARWQRIYAHVDERTARNGRQEGAK